MRFSHPDRHLSPWTSRYSLPGFAMPSTNLASSLCRDDRTDTVPSPNQSQYCTRTADINYTDFARLICQGVAL